MAAFTWGWDPEALDAPITDNLRYETLRTISCNLCTKGALKNWKNVACELGYPNQEIVGHFSNYDGCEPALMMLSDFAQKGGRVRELVEVFVKLEIFSCLEDMNEDLEKYQETLHKQKKTAKEDDGDDSPGPSNSSLLSTHDESSDISSNTQSTWSSGPSSVFSYSAPDTLLQSGKLPVESIDPKDPETLSEDSRLTSVDTSLRTMSHSSDSSCSTGHDAASLEMLSVENISIGATCNASSGEEELSCPIANEPKREKDFVSYRSRPQGYEKESSETEVTYSRSASVPQSLSPKSLIRKFFNRSKSVDSENTSRGKKKKKKFKFSGRCKKKEKSHGKATVERNVEKEMAKTQFVTDKESYFEAKENPRLNYSPLNKETKDTRPVSSSSDDSVPPNSPDYESGYNSLGRDSPPLKVKNTQIAENYLKHIYIICHKADYVIYCQAEKLYKKFKQKGYQCHMDSIDFREVRETGKYRYVHDKVKSAHFVFLCVSPGLKDIFEANDKEQGKFQDDDDRSLYFSSNLILGDLAGKGHNENGKFMTVLLRQDSKEHIPFFMFNYCQYCWPKEEHKMENTIHNRPDYPLPPVGTTRVIPVQKVATSNGVKIMKVC